MSGFVTLVKHWRSTHPDAVQTTETNSWIELRAIDPEVQPQTEPLLEPTSVSRTTEFDNVTMGLNIVQVIFSAIALGYIISTGKWTGHKLEQAISDVEKKQREVTAFRQAMEISIGRAPGSGRASRKEWLRRAVKNG